MAIDASIYNALGRGVKSVQDYDNEAMQAQSNALGLQSQRMNLLGAQQKQQEYTRGLAEQEGLRNALLGAPDDNARIERAMGLGTQTGFSYADTLRKAQIEQRKGNAAAGKDEAQATGYKLDQSIKAHEFHVQRLGAVSDPQGAVAWAAEGLKSGVFTPEQYDRGMQALQQASQSPQAFAQWKQQALQGGVSATEQLKAQAEAEKQAEQGRHNKSTEALTQRGQDVTASTAARGQNMVDARARDLNTTTLTKPFEVTGPDGKPMLVRQDKQGNITPVDGYGPKAGAAKPLNDSQAKALLFGSRMQEADKILNGLSAKGVNTPSLVKQGLEGLPLIGGALGAVANATLATDDQQSVEQAQRDFVNAVLRRESGAAISSGEFDSARKQYFPAVGDSEQVKAQKAANRQLAIRGLLAEVPDGQRGSITATDAAAGKAPKPGAILRFDANGNLVQ